MTNTKFGEQACRQVLARLDSYIDNELLTESSLDLVEHFERCTACTREAQERRKARTRLQNAVRGAYVPAGLEERVRDRLRQSQQPHAKKFYPMAIAATLAVCLGSLLTYQAIYRFGALRATTASQQSYIAAISGQVATVIRVGLGDHLHCAVIRQRSNAAIRGIDKLPAQYKQLIPMVHQYVPADLPLSVAHECSFQGRKFIHLTFRNGRSLLSLVIARRQAGESLGATSLLSQSGVPIYTAGVQQFQVAAFESRDFLVYTVSDLPHQKNLAVMIALAPTLRNLLDQMGA
jgi:anti-sigma factor RsiW